jgi:hypothetical protein
MKRSLKNALGVFDDLGCEVIKHSVTGKTHYKIVVTFEGNEKFFIAPSTPSDGRALKNFRCDVKKWLRSISSGEYDGNRGTHC